MSGSPIKRQRRERFDLLTQNANMAMREIVEYIAAGQGLRKFATEHDIAMSSIHDWITRDPERSQRYDQARRLGAGALVEKSLSVLDEAERNSAGDLTSPGVLLAKTKSETLRWIAARLAPKDWGDSVEVRGTLVNFDFRAVLEQRESRLLAIAQQGEEKTIQIEQNADLCARETYFNPEGTTP